jgi:hypothetical protein
LNLTGEIIFIVTLGWAMLAATAAMMYMCTIHGVTSSDSSSDSSSGSDLLYQNTYKVCTDYNDCVAGLELCQTECDYSECSNPTTAKQYAKDQNEEMGKYHDYANDRLCASDYTCRFKGASGFDLCGKCPATNQKYCYEKVDRRRLSFVESHAVALFGTSRDSLTKHSHSFLQSTTKHARMLSESDAEEDIEKVRKYAKEGCDAGRGFYIACYGGFFFGLMSLIFSSINTCNCCNDCCGGYQGQYRCFGIYSIISAVWQLICIGLLSVLLSSVSNMNNMYLKYCKDAGVSDCETSEGFGVLRGIETALGICMAVAVFVFLGRLLTAIFSLIAAGEEHSGKKEAQVEVPMQRVVVQQLQPVVVKNPQQNYV